MAAVTLPVALKQCYRVLTQTAAYRRQQLWIAGGETSSRYERLRLKPACPAPTVSAWICAVAAHGGHD
ncbi:hypothetical protein [Mycobacteroides abscessus]|uniref:hypothetical protein n=1 Tax=Mycobacteroides abscessus TaxID=36809 RepID=UPI0013FD0C01|nr:hypothetical protein [Mycobacteroides abscessus]